MLLGKIKRIHFTGIKGVGMTALACIARDFGMVVSGSDVKDRFVTDETLQKKGIKCQIGFKPKIIEKVRPELLVYGAAHQGEENDEVKKAKRMGVATTTQGELLGAFFNTKQGISVGGVGGKTTTAAMLATILSHCDKHPSYLVGSGEVGSLDFPGRYDQAGKIFIAEADEYYCSPTNPRPKFHYQNPIVIVLTNLAFDHPDIYKDVEQTLQIFKSFIEKLPKDGALIVNYESPLIRTLIERSKVKARIITFGERWGDWRLTQYHADQEMIFFEIKKKSDQQRFILSVPGKINALNAIGAVLGGRFFGLTYDEIASGLMEFTGTRRRFEKIFQLNSCQLFDDYAHHPIQIEATLKTAREWLVGKEILVIFQPHTYSRTKVLLPDFAKSFSNADQVVITNIFASAREKKRLGVSGRLLVEATAKFHKKVNFCAGQEETIAYLEKQALKNTAIFTLGAGDIFLWHEDIIKVISKSIFGR